MHTDAEYGQTQRYSFSPNQLVNNYDEPVRNACRVSIGLGIQYGALVVLVRFRLVVIICTCEDNVSN